MGRGNLMIAGLLLAVVMLPGGSLVVADLSQDQDAEFLDIDGARLRITVDRTMGLVPLKVKISGDLRGKQQNAMLAPDQHVFVEVESSYVRVVGSDRSRDLNSGGVAEIDSAGVEHPMSREIVIHRPGTYRFRLIVRDEDGNELLSNKVKVKAM
jgi:hypothetical protein